MTGAYDRAQLGPTLALEQGESSWLCFEGRGHGHRGVRHVAGLAWVHRTGPRPTRIGLGPMVLERDALPSILRSLVPSWLPIVSPIDLGLDARPLVMVVVFDLDVRDAAPMVVELPAVHFDRDTFAAATAGRRLEVGPTRIAANTDAFALDLNVRQLKPAVTFGRAGSPMFRHGDIEIGYVQRPRVEVRGHAVIAGEKIADLVAIGAHDRHWRSSTVIGLHWIWLHVRLAGERELVAYVVRDTRTEVARAAWEIDRDAAVSLIPTFELRVLESAETAHGAIAVRVELGWGQHRLTLEHAVRSPYIRMRAFGDVLDLGIYEGPVRAVNGVGCEGGWLEVMPSFRPSR